jgi:hypothetical protein
MSQISYWKQSCVRSLVFVKFYAFHFSSQNVIMDVRIRVCSRGGKRGRHVMCTTEVKNTCLQKGTARNVRDRSEEYVSTKVRSKTR